jgi:hypothetical protein
VQRKRAILLDASSAILLFKVGLLGGLLAAYQVRVARSVYRELTVADRLGAREFEGHIRSGLLQVIAALPSAGLAVPAGGGSLDSLGEGERDTLLHFCDGQGDFVVIDDGRGARYCRSTEIPFINALLVPRVFSLAGRLPEKECTSAFDRLAAIGRYSGTIVDYARRAQPRDLAFFLPDSR